MKKRNEGRGREGTREREMKRKHDVERSLLE
jgi:hypothetical protein